MKQLVVIPKRRLGTRRPSEQVALFNADGTQFGGFLPGELVLFDQFTTIEAPHNNYSQAAWFGAHDEEHPGQLTSSGTGIEFVNTEEDGIFIEVSPGLYEVQFSINVYGNALPVDNEEPDVGWGAVDLVSFVGGPSPDYNPGVGRITDTHLLTRFCRQTGVTFSSRGILRAIENNSQIYMNADLNNAPTGWTMSVPRFRIARIGA